MNKSTIIVFFAFGFLGRAHFSFAQLYTPNGTTTSTTNPSTGNVGIGTSSPGFKLHVYTSTNLDGLRLEHSNGAWQSNFSPSLTGGAFNGITQSGDAGIIFGSVNGVNTVSNGFVIAPHRTTSSGLRIDNIGNVGIGTSSPSSKLDVSDANTDLSILKLRNLAWTCNQRASIEFWNGANKNYPTSRIVSQMDGCGTDGEALSFETQTAGQTSPSPKLIIKNNGNVGIGTTSPSAKLTVNQINANGWGGNLNAVSVVSPDNAYRLDVNTYVVASGNVGYHFSPNANTGMVITTPGNVGIGTTVPDAKLAVKGQVHANEVRVDLNVPGPDYVFEKDYQLTPLEDIKTYIDQNKHLPEVPSAREMEKNGVQLGEMNMLLLKKIEELTLYVIEQNKRMDDQSKRISALEAENSEVKISIKK